MSDASDQARAVTAESPPETDAPPDAVAPPPNHLRFPLFDGLRAIAVLLVVLNHTSGAPDVAEHRVANLLYHMNFGVTIFFLISGFLLYRPFAAHRAGGAAAPRFLIYAKRRALRILPAYWVCLTIVALIPGAIALSAPNLLAQYGLIETLPTSGDGSCVSNFATCELAHTWSLAVELTFYALLPLYVIAADRLARGRTTRSWVTLELSLLVVLSVVTAFAKFIVFKGDSTSITGGTAFGFTLWFALGMGLAVLSVAHEASTRESRAVALIRRRPGMLWLIAIGLYVALSEYLPPTPFIFDQTDQLLVWLLFGVCALLLLLPATFAQGSAGVPGRILAHPLVSWFGLVSYGVFLWHNVVILELARRVGALDMIPLLAITLVVGTALAAASYYLIERQAMRFKNKPLLGKAPATVSSPSA